MSPGAGRRRRRTGLVGLGWAARNIWLPRLRCHPAFEVVAAADVDPAARVAIAAEHPGLPVFEDAAGIVAADLDLALVAIPNRLHCEVACALLEGGVDVFVEKPVCTSRGEADRLARAAAAGGARLVPSTAARFRDDVRWLAQQRDGGALGPLRSVDVEWVRARGVPSPGGWFTRRELSGGGVLLDLGWHLLDLGLWLLGFPGLAGACAVSSADFAGDPAFCASWHGEAPAGGAPADVEDTVTGLLAVEGPAALGLRAAWASHQPVDTTRVVLRGRDGCASLLTTFGFSANRVAPARVRLRRRGSTCETTLEAPVGVEYDRQVDALADLLRGPDRSADLLSEVGAVADAVTRLQACLE